MIEIKKLTQAYGSSRILWGVDLSIEKGRCTCIMGRNGVGKTTLLKCLLGLLPVTSGSILLEGVAIEKKRPSERARMGLGYVPQGRDIFSALTVEENLRVALSSVKSQNDEVPEKIFTLFPVLKSMLSRRGGDLSGGQQQQLAIARALALDPRVLILDEPNEGIQPNIVTLIGEVIAYLNEQEKLTVVLVEQKTGFARRVGHEFRLMEKGQIVAADSMNNLTDNLIKQHLAV